MKYHITPYYSRAKKLYIISLILSVLIYFILYGASGHRFQFSLKNYLILSYITLSILFLCLEKYITNQKKPFIRIYTSINITLILISIYYCVSVIIDLTSIDNLPFNLFIIFVGLGFISNSLFILKNIITNI